MATAEQLKALLRSYAEGDESRFLSIAMQVAAHAAKSGHGKLAQELREVIDEVKKRGEVVPRRAPIPTPLVQPRGELAGLLSVTYPTTRMSELVLEGSVRQRLERILREHRLQFKLREHGLVPRHRVLLVGPPGSGKTMTASALAGEMSLPLFTIVLDVLITKFMGETAAKLRLVFDAIRSTRGVYLFDEFDAIGGKRNAQNDVGEIRRVLNSFLQFVEEEQSGSLIIAATNHPEMLDHALFRRFDDVIEYDYPAAELIQRMISSRLGTFRPPNFDSLGLADSAKGLSYAEIARACDDATKEAVLSDDRQVSADVLQRAFKERRSTRQAK